MSITYSAYEVRRSMLPVLRSVAALQTDLISMVIPANGGHSVRAANRVLQALDLTHERPSFGIDQLPGDITVTEREVTATPFGRIIRFVKHGETSGTQPKVLVVPGLAGHYATLVRGTVRALLADHDVYVADWSNARDIPVAAGRFGLDEYIAHLMDFVRAIGPGTHLLSVCQPAVACLAAASLMTEDGDPARPASLILLAGPVDTRVNPGRVGRFAERQSIGVLKHTVIQRVPRNHRGSGRRVYPGFLQVSGFMAMDPLRHVRTFADLFGGCRRGDEEATNRIETFYREYFAVLDITEEFYLETAQRIFKDNTLARGDFQWRSRAVDPGVIDSALFTIEGANDEMCPPGQTEAAQHLCTGIPEARRRHLVQEGVGHYGVFAGSIFDTQIYPQIREFIAGAAKID